MRRVLRNSSTPERIICCHAARRALSIGSAFLDEPPLVGADYFPRSWAPPQSVTLDIDGTVDVEHGHQQLSLFNAHHDERCFLPIYMYDTATGRTVAVILRPGKTPAGREIPGHVRRLVRRIRARGPKNPHPDSRRWPLWPARGDGLVRG